MCLQTQTDRWQSEAAPFPGRPAGPLLEELAGDVMLSAVENAGEGLLEQVGAVQGAVAVFERGELALLVE